MFFVKVLLLLTLTVVVLGESEEMRVAAFMMYMKILRKLYGDKEKGCPVYTFPLRVLPRKNDVWFRGIR